MKKAFFFWLLYSSSIDSFSGGFLLLVFPFEECAARRKNLLTHSQHPGLWRLTHAYPPYLNKAIPKNRHHPKKRDGEKTSKSSEENDPELCCR
jgi:hypothetical protein